MPAALMGLYGIRPTLGTLSTADVLPLVKERDTLGYVRRRSRRPRLTRQFTRSPQLFAHFGRLWYGEALRLTGVMPRTVYVERSLLSAHPAARQLHALLAEVASRFSLEIVPVSIEERWARAENGTLRHALREVSSLRGASRSHAMLLMIAGQAVVMQQQYAAVGRDLVAEYRRRNEGRLPYIPADLLARWLPKPHISGEEKQRIYALIASVASWLCDTSGLVEVRGGPVTLR